MRKSARFTWMTVAALAVGGSVGLLVHLDGPHPPSARTAAPAAAAVDRTAAELARLDGQIRGRTQRAQETQSWLAFELVANDYMGRARLSNDWGDFQHAQEMLTRAFALAPAGAGPWASQASLDYTLHRLARVEDDLEHIEHFAVYSIRDRALVRSMRADVAFHSGRYPEARALYEAQLTADPSLANLVGLAQMEWKTGHAPRAATLLQQASAKAAGEPRSTRAWLSFVQGQMALDLGRDEEAMTRFRAGLELMPGYPLIEEHLAEVELSHGLRAEAKATYTRLVARTNDPEFMDQLARIARADGDDATFRRWRDHARALHERRIRMFPEAAYGHALQHWVDLENDPARTVVMAERNRDARPGGEAQTMLIEAYVLAGRTADAVRVADGLVATEWDTGEGHAACALAYRVSGDVTRARAQSRLAEAVQPGATESLEWIEARRAGR